MDGYELAGMLFGHKRSESDASERLRDLTISGVAESDSADGLVSISLDGDLTQAEDDGLEHDGSIAVPTEVGVYEGDEVAVTLTGADLSTLRVTGVIGNGDRQNAAIAAARTIANAAQAVADAVNQHFFADINGIHVTEVTQEEWGESPTGANVLINSIGQLFRDGLNNLLTLTTENGARALTIWDGLGNAAGNVLATFGATETHIGMSGTGNVYMANDKFLLSASTSEWETEDSNPLRHVTQEAILNSTMAEQVLSSNCNIHMTNSQEVNEGGSGGATVYIGAGIGPTDGNDPEEDVYASVEVSADLGGGSSITLIADQISYTDPYGGSFRQLGKPQRLTSGASYTAGTADTMGPAVTLTAGIWLIEGSWAFTNSSSNAKRLVVGLYRSSTGNAYTYRIHTTASSSSAHRLEVSDTIVVSASSETVTLYGSSSPASTSAGTQYITAIRLA